MLVLKINPVEGKRGGGREGGRAIVDNCTILGFEDYEGEW
jgi:hypothetical protein